MQLHLEAHRQPVFDDPVGQLRAVISPLLGEKNTVQRFTSSCSATMALAQS
jgi:hypothetical protein